MLSENLEENIKFLKLKFMDCFDVIFREFTLGKNETKCLLVYIQEIVNTETINKNFFHSLMEDFNVYNVNLDKKEALEAIKNKFIEIGNVEKITLLEEAVEDILDGKCVFLISGISAGLSLNTSKWQHRSIGEPISEAVVRGPSESFTEAISINISLIRKRLKTHNLKMEKLEIGHLSRTRVVMSYIKGVACEKVVNEARKRLEKIDIDSINDSGEIEQFIEDNPYSPFPQISYTERPDIVSACLSDGKVAVLVDGSPLVLVFPAVFVDFLSSPEDYYVRFYFGTFIRMLRYIAFVIALFLPSIYVAMTTYHQEMIPMSLLTTLIAVRAAVPFPAVIEALLMEFTFEVLKKAGIRLPKPIGEAVSIVGALILGELAVSIGIVSNVMVIIVAFTGIASFVIPKYNQSISIRLLRFPLMILAGSTGLFGIITGFLFLLIHLVSLRSFGVPYFSPFSPLSLPDWKDSMVRFPIWTLRKKPEFMKKRSSKIR
ncbi:spore germination protein [Acetivibrio saccincola]|uniref:Spore germination protein A1 n=2 Tax=Acetivibrio saccincola TaxID=1677857 RepID=A0A2K9E5P0_9FIRM|nr:spore germination protein [Acetivibrio saccincola]AUG58679.1 Spore germination protein A1 [Acetivibrio saccincola]